MQNSLFETSSTWQELHPLRGRQIPLIPAIYDAVKQGHKRIVVQLPTGAGKTVCAAHLMDRSAKKGRRPMFVAPAIALVEQTLASFETQGISDIGIIQARHERTDFTCQIQIASRDTLVRRSMPEVDLVIVDECHDNRQAMLEIMNSEAWKSKIVIGLSATPWSKGMGLHWSKLIVGATMREMMDDGPPTGLCEMKAFGVPADFEPDFSGVKRVGDDLDEGATAKIMNVPKLVGNAVDHWLKTRQEGEHPGDRTFLRGVNRAHAKSLMEAFNAAGIKCGYVDGESSKEDRKREFDKYRSKETKVLASVRVLGVGVDEDVRCMVDCAKTISEINHVQWWGRGIRLADGKTHVFGLDHAGNCTNLGMPWDIHHDHLDSRTPKEKGDAYEDDKPAPKPRKCRKCHAIIPPRTKACPACGDVYAVTNTIEHEAGELVLIGSDDTLPKKKKSKKPEDTMADKQEFYSGLLYLARERGRADGFAAHRYRERFGVWPNQLDKRSSPPSPDVLRFDKHSRIKFIKSKQAQEAASV